MFVVFGFFSKNELSSTSGMETKAIAMKYLGSLQDASEQNMQRRFSCLVLGILLSVT